MGDLAAKVVCALGALALAALAARLAWIALALRVEGSARERARRRLESRPWLHGVAFAAALGVALSGGALLAQAHPWVRRLELSAAALVSAAYAAAFVRLERASAPADRADGAPAWAVVLVGVLPVAPLLVVDLLDLWGESDGLLVAAGGGLAVAHVLGPRLALYLVPRRSGDDPRLAPVLERARALGVDVERLHVVADEPDELEDPEAVAVAMGLGRVRSMWISERLFAWLDGDALLAVVGHEWGHVRLAHLRRTALLSLAAFTALGLGLHALGDAERARLALSIVGLAAIPAGLSWVSRRMELAADRFAADLVGEEALARALRTLHERMRIAPERRGVLAALGGAYASHPPLTTRLDALGARAAGPQDGGS